MKPFLGAVLMLAAAAVVAALFVGTGLYNVAADAEHTAPVYRLLAFARDRSIAVRAAKVDVPDLADPQRVRRGAGNYDSMCASCHLAPGAEQTELSRGLYPQPPELSRSTDLDAARAFWVIKHGIKASGMPAWGKSMEDSYIWDMVAFLQQLPRMSAEQYGAEVRASGGHSHGGGETTSEGGHSHDDDEHSHDEADGAGLEPR
jgi:mono/diheme cytochrome c family protein